MPQRCGRQRDPGELPSLLVDFPLPTAAPITHPPLFLLLSQNPGFEADSGENPYPATSWTADRTTSTMPIAYTDGYGYNPSSPMSGDDGHAFVTRSAVGNDPGMATVTQTGIKVCGLYTYAFELYVGRKAQAQSDHGDCKIEVMLTQGESPLLSSPPPLPSSPSPLHARRSSLTRCRASTLLCRVD